MVIASPTWTHRNVIGILTKADQIKGSCYESHHWSAISRMYVGFLLCSGKLLKLCNSLTSTRVVCNGLVLLRKPLKQLC